MSTFRNPVGPETPNVYWRRRLVVGIGALAVIVIILLIVFAPKGDKTPAASGTKPPASAEASDASTAAPASDLPACNAKDLVVTAVVDKAAYTAEETPQLAFTIKNTGKADCAATAGTDVQEFAVTSGKETIWSSKDCQQSPAANVASIKAGEELPSAAIAWDRTRSTAATCDGVRTPATAGGASYHLDVTVNGVKSTNSPQFSLK